MNAINDALSLRSLENFSTLNVPIQHATNWNGTWLSSLGMEVCLAGRRLYVLTHCLLTLEQRISYICGYIDTH